MASIEEVKAALMQAAEQGNATINQIRAAAENTEQMLTRLRAVAAGTGHPTIAEAIARGEQSKRPGPSHDARAGQLGGRPPLRRHPRLNTDHHPEGWRGQGDPPRRHRSRPPGTTGLRPGCL